MAMYAISDYDCLTMFSLKKTNWAAWAYMLSVALIRCKNEALKKLHLKSTIKCFKEVKIDKWPDLSYSFLPIDCCVRINGEHAIYSKVIFSHRYLDSDRINFQTFVFLAVYWSIWTSSCNTDIRGAVVAERLRPLTSIPEVPGSNPGPAVASLGKAL